MAKAMLFAVALLATESSGAGTAGYVACMAGCNSWCAAGAAGGPAGYSACVAGCAVACVCFPTDTQVTMADGQMSLADVKVGDKVLTQDDAGQDVFTAVTQVTYFSGNFSFAAMTLDDHSKSVVTATDWHGMPVKTTSGLAMKEAAQVVKDDVLLVRGVGAANVAGTQRFFKEGKYSISTESCTMYANNVLTTTTCMDEQISRSFVQKMEQPPTLDAEFFLAAGARTQEGVVA